MVDGAGTMRFRKAFLGSAGFTGIEADCGPPLVDQLRVAMSRALVAVTFTSIGNVAPLLHNGCTVTVAANATTNVGGPLGVGGPDGGSVPTGGSGLGVRVGELDGLGLSVTTSGAVVTDTAGAAVSAAAGVSSWRLSTYPPPSRSSSRSSAAAATRGQGERESSC